LELRYATRIIIARIRIHGFLFCDFPGDMGAFHTDMSAMVKAGQITARETVFDGLESAPEAFLGLFRGANTGKMLVKL
jgi:NADPH-dependent curcumin reductase CurA